jgi:hypothetical protein
MTSEIRRLNFGIRNEKGAAAAAPCFFLTPEA